ncbi:transcription antitermination factor NusB [Dysgonomonas sp. 520]|uniref:transcription antitermination factor NusB n=1 Tax=Dysgonomonas sp. 520 TaxID=2302931 RepID=UPI0013D005AB|nr:transcription antitermination factor NusB [Dysgonomonas sp. 520]NDW09882.1 transcription antitermination factor NusB [Dysgonomonas sp. 520]
MINRVLIRIRVVQILYSAHLSENKDLKKIESELSFSLQKSYDLYFYLLLLLVEITEAYSKKVEQRKSKHLPSLEDMNPNTRLLENKFILQLKSNKRLIAFLLDRPMSWDDNSVFVKKLLENILESDTYKDYIGNKDRSYETDREFWRKIFRQFIENNEELESILEEESLYWNDDIDIIESFVLKTIKRFEEEKGEDQELLPMFKDAEDNEFAVRLLRESLLNSKEYNEMIAQYAKNWESERIALMDQLIMQIAIAEIMNFPNIPISVTLNEYINIVKVYSTQKSAAFINGILDSIVSDLKKDQKIVKK